jgi:hypothetical protein
MPAGQRAGPWGEGEVSYHPGVRVRPGLHRFSRTRHRPWTVVSGVAGVAGVVVTLAAVAITLRLAHPARFGTAYATFADDFDTPLVSEARWRVTAGGEHVVQLNGSLALRPPAARAAGVEALLPEAPNRWGAAWLAPDVERAPRAEELSWRGAAAVSRRFFGIVEWAGVHVQRTPGGLHVTAPDGRGGQAGFEWQDARGVLRAPVDWRLVRSPVEVSLSAGGERVWSMPVQPGHPALALQNPRFGDTATDDLHEGQLELDWVRYTRRVARR